VVDRAAVQAEAEMKIELLCFCRIAKRHNRQKLCRPLMVGVAYILDEHIGGGPQFPLRAGRGAIVDATFERSADRAKALAIAQELKVPVLFVECVASREEAIRRLNARTTQRSEEISDATPEVYEMRRNEFKPLTEIPARNYMMVDTGRGREELLAKIEAALEGGLHTQKNAVC